MINACDILKKLVKTFDVPIEIKSTIEYFSTLSLNTYKKFYVVSILFLVSKYICDIFQMLQPILFMYVE